MNTTSAATGCTGSTSWPLADHTHDESVSSVGIALDGDLDAKKLNKWMSELLQTKGPDIFRMKGDSQHQERPEPLRLPGRAHALRRPGRQALGQDAADEQAHLHRPQPRPRGLTEGFRTVWLNGEFRCEGGWYLSGRSRTAIESTMARLNIFGKSENKLRPVWQSAVTDHAIGLSWSPDGSRLAAAAVSGPITIFDAATGKPVARTEATASAPPRSPGSRAASSSRRPGRTARSDSGTRRLGKR